MRGKLLEYATPARVIYYMAIAAIAFIAKAVAELLVGPHGATSALVLLMWLLLVADTKVVPPNLSLLRPFLPGIGWGDLLVTLAICIGFALYAYYAGQISDQREFMVSFMLAMGAFFVLGIVGLFRWQRWRGRR
jgi:hypothetical protein